MNALLQDLRYAYRTMRKSPGFTAVAVATVALAIGANTAIFSFVNALLLNPLPYPDSDRIVRVMERRPDGGVNGISTLNYLDWAEQNTVFEYLAARGFWPATLTGGEEPIQIFGGRVSAEFFRIYGVTPALGRTFAPGEDQLGNDKVVVLSHALWETRFGADPEIVGRSLTFNGEPHTVIGVLRQAGEFDRNFAQIWKPLAFEAENMTRDFHWFIAFAKLKPGVTVEQAQAEMSVIGARIAEQYPDIKRGWGIAVEPLAEILVQDNLRTAAIVLFAATGLVLLIGCANLASLALARGVSRERETAVRTSLGASGWRLARQFLTENVVISVLGGIAGLALGYATMRWMAASIPPFALPAEVDIRMDGAVMLFSLTMAVATGLLFGSAPALQAGRANLVASMKEGGHGATPGTTGRRVRATLVVAEIALAFVLLVGSGLLMRSLFSILDVDPGFDPSNVLTAGLPIAEAEHPDPVELNLYIDAVRAAIASVPGVTDTAVTSALPLQGWGWGMPYEVADREAVERAGRSGGFFKMVSPSYFEALRMRVIAGRALNERDAAGAPPAMVINETLAKREFPNESAVGKRLRVQEIIPGRTELGPEIPWEVVGVVADEKINGLTDQESAGMYVSNLQTPVYGVSLIVRTELEPLALQGAIRAAIDTVNKNQALSQVRTLEQIASESVDENRLQSTLLGVFAAIALLLAAVGIYGVVSYGVVQRTQEIGIRAALGASAGSLQRLIFGGGMRLTLIGLAVGALASLGATRAMSSMLFGVSAYDPVTMAAVAGVLVTVAASACVVPARRVTRVNPNVALRRQ